MTDMRSSRIRLQMQIDCAAVYRHMATAHAHHRAGTKKPPGSRRAGRFRLCRKRWLPFGNLAADDFHIFLVRAFH